MRGTAHKTRAVACALIASLVGCAPKLPVSSVEPMPVGTGTGTVQLSLEGFGQAPRQAQYVPAFAMARFSIDGATLAASRSTLLSFSLGASAVTLRNVPVGSNMVLTVDGLDTLGLVMPSAHYATTMTISPGATVSTSVGVRTTPTAEVVRTLLGYDRQASRDASHSLAARLDAPGLQTILDHERSRLGLVHPVLFDSAAIAHAIAQGADPTATTPVPAPAWDYSSYLVDPDRVYLVLSGLPEGAVANVWIDDPLSTKQNNLPSGGTYVSPVFPGTWTVHADVPNGPSATASVTVPWTSPTVLDFSRWQQLTSLPKALAGTANAVLNLGGTNKLVLAGGVDGSANGDGTVSYATSSCYAFDGVRLSPLPAMPVPLAYAASAQVGGTLYVFGGMGADGSTSSDVYAFNGQSWSGPIATVSANTTPTPLAGAAAAAFGSVIYLFGGSVNSFAQAFDTVSKQFTAVPAMNVPCDYPASTVYQGRLYVFGGSTGNGFVSSSEAFDPVAAKWTSLKDLPIARFGAQAIAYRQKIYVIGGMASDGRASARVDVYDPATDTWALYGALNVPRGAEAVTLLNGNLYVYGGSDGLFYDILSHTTFQKPVPVPALEVLKP